MFFQCNSTIKCDNKEEINNLKAKIEQVLEPAAFDESNLYTTLGHHDYCKNVLTLEIDVITRLLRKKWRLLQNVILNDSIITQEELMTERRFINKSLQLILECLQMCNSPTCKECFIQDTIHHIESFSTSVIWLHNLGYEKLTKLSCYIIENTQSPLHYYFHTFLDIQYYFLLIYYISSQHKLLSFLEELLKSLIIMSKRIYNVDETEKESYICSCVEKFWFITIYITDKVGDDIFWKTFNTLLTEEEPLFVLWILRDISQAHSNAVPREKFKSNYGLLETNLKSILLSSNSCTVFKSFTLIEPIICSVWFKDPKIEVLQIIWDYFSKRLNVINNKQMNLSFSTTEFMELIDTISWCPKDCKEDFQYFVGLLLTHLKEYPMHWGKMKGRIYSQLGPNKIKDLTEVGIVHVTILFMSLSGVNFEECIKKLLSILDNLPHDKKDSPLVWNMYLVIVLKHVREGRSVEKSAPYITKMLTEASNNTKSFHLIKNFVTNMEYVISFSLNMDLHQWLFIDKWLNKYLATCYYQDLTTTLNLFATVLDRVTNTDSWTNWQPMFKETIYPLVKQISCSNNPPSNVGNLAGRLLLLMPDIFNECFNFFNNESMAPHITSSFLCVILKNYPKDFILSHAQEVMVVQSWVKVCLLTVDSYDKLTNIVVKLDYFPNIIRPSVVNGNDPLLAFVKALGENNNLNSNNLCESCFENSDRWILQVVSQPENEAVVTRLYFIISQCFLCCGHALYNRNKPSSPLTRLILTLLLPTEFLIGKAHHPYVLSALKKTWNVYFEAIVKLNTSFDTFLERTLRDLIVKYVPYFSSMDSPILKCLDNEVTAAVILEKISTSYFNHPTKESDANVSKTLQIINEYIQSTTSMSVLKLIINKSLYGLFEVVIFHNQRNKAILVVKSITCSPLYDSVREDFGQVVVAITEKHLVFNTTNYFQFMNVLIKFVPKDVKNLLNHVRQKIAHAERMRGVGFDKTLRQHLQNLEKALDKL